jgi:hypothetical protein
MTQMSTHCIVLGIQIGIVSLINPTKSNMPQQPPTNDKPPSMESTKSSLWRRLRKLLKLCKEYRKERADAKRKGNDGWVQADDYEGYMPLTRSNLYGGAGTR